MKLINLLMTLALCVTLSAQAQEVTVVGVSSRQKTSNDDALPKNYTVMAPGLYEAVYTYTMKTSDKEGKEATAQYLTILQIGEQQALFGDYTSYQTDSLNAAGAPAEAIRDAQDREAVTECYFAPRILLNSPDGEISVTDVAGITMAAYTEPFGAMEWELTEDSDSIGGYQATKAITNYGGRTWEAWYTEEIPSEFGPWKLAGLPGLIVKATDTEGIHDFELTGFRQTDTPLMAVKDARVVNVGRDKFIEQRNRVYNAPNPMSTIDMQSISNMVVMKNSGGGGTILINGVQLRNPKHKQIPLELK